MRCYEHIGNRIKRSLDETFRFNLVHILIPGHWVDCMSPSRSEKRRREEKLAFLLHHGENQGNGNPDDFDWVVNTSAMSRP